MGLISLLRTAFSLDSLDYRLTADTALSSSPAKSGTLPSSSRSSSVTPESAASRKLRQDAAPSNWKTPEFLLYYFTFATVVPLMFKVAFDVSKGGFNSQSPITSERC